MKKQDSMYVVTILIIQGLKNSISSVDLKWKVRIQNQMEGVSRVSVYLGAFKKSHVDLRYGSVVLRIIRSKTNSRSCVARSIEVKKEKEGKEKEKIKKR